MADRGEREFSSQAPAGYIGDFLSQGIFPYLQGFMQNQFDNIGTPDATPFTYTGDRIAEFDPREQYAMDMSDAAIGSYRPYLAEQAQLLSDAGASARRGTAEGQELMRQGFGAGADFTAEAAGLTRGAQPDFRQAAGLIEGAQGDYGQSQNLINASMGNYGEVQDLLRSGAPNLDLARRETAAARPDFTGARSGLGRAEQTGIGSTGMFDPASASKFYDPYEEQVVQQTLKDVREGLAKGDMGLRDEAVSGGAFGGSRSRMRRDELAENAARGAAEQVGALRSQGFGRAQQQAQQAFEAQQGRRAGLAGLQSGLAGQRGTLAGAEGQAALARGSQFGNLSSTEAANQLARAQGLAGVQGQAAGQRLGAGQALAGIQGQAAGQRLGAGQALAGIQSAGAANQLARSQQLGGLGQQAYGMGTGAGQGIAGLGSQLGQNLAGYGQATGAMGQQLAGLQGQDINRTMGMGSLGRGRSQAGLDRNYSDFVGTYNLPMTTLSNTGSILGALGPMAGGFGYAGSSAPMDYGTSGQSFYPTQTMGAVGGGGGDVMARNSGGGGFFGGGIRSLPGGFYGMGGMPNYGSTATTGTYGMNMPVA